MAITYDDVKLMQSQLLDDSDDGGGYMTGNEVVDGNVNNLFPDKSRLDMVYGRVSLRKAFLAILSNTVDTYYGSHIILTQQAVDPRVNVCMFDTKSMSDVRTVAQDYIESYVVPSVLFVGQLVGTHLAGSMSISLAQRTDRTAPMIGDVLQFVEGSNTQYVKLLDIKSQTQSFWDAQGQSNYNMNILTCDIGTALIYTFHGPEVTRGTAQGDVAVYTTKVADTAKYYSISPLTEAVAANDSVLQIESIWTHLVPSAQSESVVADESPTAGTLPVIADGTSLISRSLGNLTIGDGGALFLSHALQRGSLALVISGAAYHDDETGNVLDVGDSIVGIINYMSGEITFSSAKSGTATVNFLPAGAPSLLQTSFSTPITVNNRALNYVLTLPVVINPGTLVVDYMAQGRWYTLRDNGGTDASGKGFLLPDIDGTGSGTINRTTNTVTVTLGALPDVGGALLYRWGEGFEFASKAETSDITLPVISYTVEAGWLNENSLTITWDSGIKSVTDDGAGVLSGDGVGTVDYNTGEITLRPTTLASSAEVFTYAYSTNLQKKEWLHERQNQTAFPWHFTVNTPTDILPGSFYMLIKVHDVEWSENPIQLKIVSDASGNLHASVFVGYNGGRVVSSYYTHSGKYRFECAPNIGTVDFSINEGEVTISADLSYETSWLEYTYDHVPGVCEGSWACSPSQRDTVILHDNYPRTAASVVGNSADCVWAIAASTGGDFSENHTGEAFSFNLLTGFELDIIPGSILFTFGGIEFQDNGEGSLYHTINPETGLGTLAGTVNYGTGDVCLTDWPAGGSSAITVNSLVCSHDRQGLAVFTFRTAGCPVRIGSFQITGTCSDGTSINATADTAGDISDANAEGHIDVTTGLITIIFGTWVLVNDAIGEPWYNPDSRDAAGTHTWKPKFALPETVKYNCVVYKYIPLDSSLLGLDPTRLPSDGRVPAFRNGYIIVIHNTLYETCPTPLSAGQVITLPRHPVSLIEMYDQSDLYVPKTYYTEDLENGTITMADPLNLSGFTEPLTAMHRIEDMCLVSDVQINGTLAIAAPVTNDYPKDTSYVSGAMPFGDKKARYHHLFDQYTWTGEWSDTLVGDPCMANYNDIDFPFEMSNKGGTTERWVLQFDSGTHFKIIGETLGQIGEGYITNDCHPINPATGADYFMIRLGGWGSGWVSGNVLRFNTDGARAPIWFCRTTLQGPSTEPEDKFTTQIRGDSG